MRSGGCALGKRENSCSISTQKSTFRGGEVSVLFFFLFSFRDERSFSMIYFFPLVLVSVCVISGVWKLWKGNTVNVWDFKWTRYATFTSKTLELFLI